MYEQCALCVVPVGRKRHCLPSVEWCDFREDGGKEATHQTYTKYIVVSFRPFRIWIIAPLPHPSTDSFIQKINLFSLLPQFLILPFHFLVHSSSLLISTYTHAHTIRVLLQITKKGCWVLAEAECNTRDADCIHEGTACRLPGPPRKTFFVACILFT